MVGLLALIGCAHSFSQLAREKPGKALLKHLQRTGDANVCHLKGSGPRLSAIDDTGLWDLANGARKSHRKRFSLALWQVCVDRLAGDLNMPQKRRLQQHLATIMASLLKAGGTSLHALPQILNLHRSVGARPVSTFVNLLPAVVAQLEEEHPPSILGSLRRWRLALNLEQGLYKDAPVTDAIIASIADAQILRQMGIWLPKLQRRTARGRQVSIALRQGDYPELLPYEAALVEQVLRRGYNPIDPQRMQPTAVEFRPTPPPMGLEAMSNFSRHQLTDLNARPATINGLHIKVQGLAQPLGLCDIHAELDARPCIDPAEVGVVAGRISERKLRALPMEADQATRVAIAGAYVATVVVADQRLRAPPIPVALAKPKPVLIQSDVGQDTADTAVLVSLIAKEVIRLDAATGGLRQTLFLRRDHYPGLRITNRGGGGADGADGVDGADGASGISGDSASCPKSEATGGSNGTTGQSGGNGTPGGDGGNGGNIVVTFACGEFPCADLHRTFKHNFYSLGGDFGAGGMAGQGGKGGEGGRGGSSAACDAEGNSVSILSQLFSSDTKVSYTISSGNRGRSGVDGVAGLPGLSGRRGQPGSVRMVSTASNSHRPGQHTATDPPATR